MLVVEFCSLCFHLNKVIGELGLNWFCFAKCHSNESVAICEYVANLALGKPFVLRNYIRKFMNVHLQS